MKPTDQPGARNLPVAFHSHHGDTQGFGYFSFAQSTKEPQFDDASGARIGRFELCQQFVQRQDVFVAFDRIPALDRRQIDSLLLATSFVGNAGPRMIDQYAPHRLCCHSEEVSAILIGD
jgi:hypothetical protein